MRSNASFARKRAHKLALLFGTTSLAALAGAFSAQAQQADNAGPGVEEVLVTGSLIHGAASVGVPVVQLNTQDFNQAGVVTIGDLLRTVPSITITTGNSASAGSAESERGTYINIHGVGALRGLLMIDGMRYPLQQRNANNIDPSVIPELAVERIDVLADGASATYGSDAIAGVVNVVLKHGFEGAVTQLRYGESVSGAGGGDATWQAAQLYGRKWDGGDITVSYQNAGADALDSTSFRTNNQFTVNYTPWGLDDKTPLASSSPGVVSTGAPSSATSTTCVNCYSIPKGQNGVGLSWTTLLANAGVKNEINPYGLADLTSPQQTNSATITFDQRLIPGISLFGEAFYQNRRSVYSIGTSINPGQNNEGTFTVPTTNPYYPIGAPAGLRVSYSLVHELQPHNAVGEIAKRWAGGFNLDLPYGWNGRLFYSSSENNAFYVVTNLANTNMINAALGNTIAAIAAAGTIPPIAAFTKPANIPYLNLFCDATAFTCNSDATLAYISAFRMYHTTNQVKESAATFDGPLFAVPAGMIRAAVGIEYTTFNFNTDDFENFGAPVTAEPTNTISQFGRQVPAAYAQLNVPVFGEANAIPLFSRLEFEGSVRYDHYSDFGGVTSPKVSFDWSPGWGLTFKGDWGTSFRAPNSNELQLSNAVVSPVNLAAGGSIDNQPTCPGGVVGSTPVPGSIGAILNPTCSAALMYQGGVTINGSIAGAAGLRPGDGAPADLFPEKAINTSIGAEFAPDFLKGLDVQATIFNVNIKDYIFAPSIANGARLTDPLYTFTFITAANPNFSQYVTDIVNNPVSTVRPAAASSITWISDGANRNTGFLKVSGIDFQVSYDFDLGDLGAYDLGLSGTYYTKNQTQNIPGGSITDSLAGNTVIPRFRYRGRVGWTDGTFTVNAYANYQSHYFTKQVLPPAAFLAKFPNYSDIEPAFTTVDLAFGYKLGETPSNDYLKNLEFQLVVNDVFDKRAPFSYFIQTSGANPGTFDPFFGESPIGRYATFIMTKTW